MKVSAEMVKELRATTGAGILDCKKALEEAEGDFAKAIELLQKRNQAIAIKKQSREAKEGRVAVYLHGEGRIGVLVEVNCETDFVARSDVFLKLVNELCLQIAAMAPIAISREDLPKEMVEKQREIFEAQVADQKKPPEILAKIVEGKMAKWFSEVCLLEQPYIRDDKMTVRDLLNDAIGRTGENIKIRRFTRYQLGEGL